MEIFTSNQVNQVLVAKKLSTLNAKLTKSSAVGDIYVGQDADGCLYFQHMGHGGITRSDMITNIEYANLTPAASITRTTNAVTVKINKDALKEVTVTSEGPEPSTTTEQQAIVGQDYVLTIELQNPMGMSPDNQYWKQGVVHVTESTKALKDFYPALANSLIRNMERDGMKDLLEVTSTAAGITIKEKLPTHWRLGVEQTKPVVFTVRGSEVTTAAGDCPWADAIYSTGIEVIAGFKGEQHLITSTSKSELKSIYTTSDIPTGIVDTKYNYRKAAELEYFAMGERADQYRGVGFPDNRVTEYIVEEGKTYDFLTLHYSYVGSNHAIQKSEKDITIICEAGVGTKLKEKIDAALPGLVWRERKVGA